MQKHLRMTPLSCAELLDLFLGLNRTIEGERGNDATFEWYLAPKLRPIADAKLTLSIYFKFYHTFLKEFS